ncbi:epsilon subunit of F1F0-ATP synthase N-terminal domain-containing protein [Lactarius deliciosus]|nr:epsilon subunit of F1F0-ATP synthase N-terminal domain-containing protein [Lactarius deliciosus]
MSVLRLVSSATRRSPRSLALGRRGYAEATDKIKLSLVLPHQAIFTSTDVVQVNLSAATGDMGILANHVPSIEPLRPGLVEVIEGAGSSKKWFRIAFLLLFGCDFLVSGGFATVHPNNKLTINAIEAAPLEDFSLEAVRANLQEAQKVLGGNGPEEDKVEARIEADVYESLQHALGTK